MCALRLATELAVELVHEARVEEGVCLFDGADPRESQLLDQPVLQSEVRPLDINALCRVRQNCHNSLRCENGGRSLRDSAATGASRLLTRAVFYTDRVSANDNVRYPITLTVHLVSAHLAPEGSTTTSTRGVINPRGAVG